MPRRPHFSLVTPLAALLTLSACAPTRPASPNADAARAHAPSRTPAQRAAQPPQDPAEDAFLNNLLARMTLEEKIGQTVQLPPNFQQGRLPDDIRDLIRAGRVGAMIWLDGAERTREIQAIAVNESRLKIPLLFGLDVIHGYRTVFPVPLASACSFDPAAIEAAERIAATEAASAGLHWTFAPMVDIARDPRWGRIVEGAGEDPYLGSVLAAARVRGFQGQSLRSTDTLLACAKHFVAYGAAEGGRDYNAVSISDRSLRETYLPPFRAAIDAGAASVMSAFNDLSGVPATAHAPLIRGVLKSDWNWPGFVVSDWESIKELSVHGVASGPAHAARLAINAGVDMDMSSRLYLDHLAAQVASGAVSESVITEAARRVLRAKYRLGLFDDPFARSNADRERRTLFTSEHRAAARDLARKSVVLLKNTANTLPIPQDAGPIALIGALATDGPSMLGPWSPSGKPEEAITILDGLRAAYTAAPVLFAPAYDPVNPDTIDLDPARRAAEDARTIILVLGEPASMSAEAKSRAAIELPPNQRATFAAMHELAQRTGKRLIVILLNGRPMPDLNVHRHAGAIVQAFFLGSETGPALADILLGRVSPGGKLAVTFPAATGQIPLYYNHRNTGRPENPKDEYTSKYIDFQSGPLYPFGHGLSYTTFDYTDLTVSPSTGADGVISLSVRVRNSGSVVGDEVVQVYTRQPVASVAQPVKALRAFHRLTLAPGESRTLDIDIPASMLAFYDADMRCVVEPGRINVMVGSSSADIRLAAPCDLVGPITPAPEPGTTFSRVRVE